MVKFFKTNWPLLLLGLIAAMILGRIMEIRRTASLDQKTGAGGKEPLASDYQSTSWRTKN